MKQETYKKSRKSAKMLAVRLSFKMFKRTLSTIKIMQMTTHKLLNTHVLSERMHIRIKNCSMT